MVRAAVIAFCVLLAGCDDRVKAPAAIAQEAHQWIAKDYGYRAPLKFEETWLARAPAADSIVCGEFGAPPELEGRPASLRYYYDAGSKHGQVEMHRLVLADQLAQPMLDQNRKLFEDFWSNYCAKGGVPT
jgi:hypothetical protein